MHSGVLTNQIMLPEDMKKIEILPVNTFAENPEDVFLTLETKRFKYAAEYDPLLAMNVSKIAPLPHQIEAVYGRILKMPRIRYLIADDPGAGKTVMAGLFIKELELRGLAKRILIVVPGHLKDQWKREMHDKFREDFEIVDRNTINTNYGVNVWEKYDKIITSMDFAKKEDIRNALESANFDLVIVDEAHKMSAYKYGNKTDETARYKLGKVLSEISTHMLFLTATPHKGDPENFRLFLDLLEPGFFANADIIKEANRRGDNPLFIRRTKEELVDFNGRKLFPPRHVATRVYHWQQDSPYEMELYNELTKYVRRQYDLARRRMSAKSRKRRNLTFALIILQRRLASSTYAALKSLERRRKRLQELLENRERMQEQELFLSDEEMDEIEDLSEEERWELEKRMESISAARNPQEIQEEIEALNHLINMAREIIDNDEEIKLTELKKSIEDLRSIYPDPKDRKIIIFTESRETLEYLTEKVRSWGHSVTTIHGGMSLEERVAAEKEFKDETDILIATEAAGEGINLQFSHLMINYDIPWNPNRLEQRMGRIHRYGQNKEVYIFNLVAVDTREGQVLDKLLTKLREIKESMGDKVFDVVSEIISDRTLSEMLTEAALSARDVDEIFKDYKVDEEIEKRIEEVKKDLEDVLVTNMDMNYIKEMRARAMENKLIPEYTQNFFLMALERAGGEWHKRSDGFISIDKIPMEIKRIANSSSFKKKYGPMAKKYSKVTFDSNIAFKTQDAEFITFGEPLFEAVLKWITDNFSDTPMKGALFCDPEGQMDGHVLFYEGQITDGLGNVVHKKVFAIYIGKNGEVREVPPHILWDLKPCKSEGEEGNIEELKGKANSVMINILRGHREEIRKERDRQAEIKKKYGIQSLNYLIDKLDEEIIKYEMKREREDDRKWDIVIMNKRRQKEEYEYALKELKDRIVRERELSIGMPNLIGVIGVKPLVGVSDEMKRDPEIERIGMEVTMNYERAHGREPVDVSEKNLGYDIISKDKEGNVRYIEVKGRAKVGVVAMTPNEWFKANNLGNNYYLYVVFNAATKPELKIIRNPAEKIKPKKVIEVVRYVVDWRDITNANI